MTVRLLTPPEAMEAWPAVAPLLKPALAVAGGRHTLWSVLDDLAAGRADLWCVWAPDADAPVAAVVARLAQYPARRLYQLHAVGGAGMDEWADEMLAAVRDRAVRLGCDGIEAGGRDGWARVGARHGFRETTRWLEMDL